MLIFMYIGTIQYPFFGYRVLFASSVVVHTDVLNTVFITNNPPACVVTINFKFLFRFLTNWIVHEQAQHINECQRRIPNKTIQINDVSVALRVTTYPPTRCLNVHSLFIFAQRC